MSDETPGKRLVDEYQALVNQKYSQGLSSEGETRLRELDVELDSGDAEFYQPILEKLRRGIEEGVGVAPGQINLDGRSSGVVHQLGERLDP